VNLRGWVSDRDPYWIYRTPDQRAWRRLARQYGGGEQVEQCFKVAEANGCRTVVVENRYVDADYRSEFSNYWSLKFAGRPVFTRRLHFFGDDIAHADVHAIPADADYLGYMVMRPLTEGVVGRTRLRPPPSLVGPDGKNAVITTSTETVSIFGADFKVDGVPFCSQDGEYIRCAHAAAWICHYSAYTRGLTGHHLTADLVSATPALLTHERQFPSKGLNYEQMQAVFASAGHPAIPYFLGYLPDVHGIRNARLDELRLHNAEVEEAWEQGLPEPPEREPGVWDTRIYSIIRRYLDSAFPVVVVTPGHAFVVCGYYEDEVDGKSVTRFVACDDQVGPYEIIENALDDDLRGPWQAILIPLPPRVWLPGEKAENDARFTLESFTSRRFREDVQEWVELAHRLDDGEVGIKTVLLKGSDYKFRLASQGRHPDVVQALRLAELSNWVWVVEAYDKAAQRSGSASVLAEFVYDCTSAETSQPHRLAASSPGLTTVTPPDKGRRRPVKSDFKAWRSLLTVPGRARAGP
jgi:hypothetical protein